jgi:tricorn protease
VALVVTDLWEPEYKGQPFEWSIYILDIETGEFRFLVEGREPMWSFDSTRLAYVRGGGLWVADVKSSEVRELFPVEEGYWVIDVAWSPDGQRIAFLHQEASLGGSPEMLLTSVDGSESTTRLISSTTWAMRGTAWFYSGRRILYVFPEAEPTGQHFDNLWTVDIETRTSVPLTTQVIVSSFTLSPSNGDWIAFVGKFPYEADPRPLNDLWLLHADGRSLLRLTHDSTSDREPRWSPDGTQIIFRRENEGLWVLNLIDGSLEQVYASPADFEVTR